MSVLPAIDMWAPILPTPEVMRSRRALSAGDARLPARVLEGRSRRRRRFARPRRAPSSCSRGRAGGARRRRHRRARSSPASTSTPASARPSCRTSSSPIAARHPDRFIPFAGADICAAWRRVRELRALGTRARLPRPEPAAVHDRRCPPTIGATTRSTPSASSSACRSASTPRPTGRRCAINDLGHPRHLDVVAGDFPELTIIVSHGGYPWVLEAVLLAWKHPHVYLELAAHRPQVLRRPRDRVGAAAALRSDDDRRQGALRYRVVPPRPAAGELVDRRVPRAAGQAGGHGEVAVEERRDGLGGDAAASASHLSHSSGRSSWFASGHSAAHRRRRGLQRRSP